MKILEPMYGERLELFFIKGIKYWKLKRPSMSLYKNKKNARTSFIHNIELEAIIKTEGWVL